MKDKFIAAAALHAAIKEVESDIESSIRHWTQAREAASIRLDLPNLTERERTRYCREIDSANSALDRLSRGERVSIFG